MPITCRHHCGIIDQISSRWDVYVAVKNSIELKCFGAILNSVYIASNPSCLSKYKSSDLIITGVLEVIIIGVVQSFEMNENIAFMKLQQPLKFVPIEGRLFEPICLEHVYGQLGINVKPKTRFLSSAFCYNPPSQLAYFYVTGCAAHDTRCFYSSGAAYHLASFDPNANALRAFIKGIGKEPTRLGEDENNFYKCNVRNLNPFFYNYFIDE